jgi:hypothetical protein
VTIRERIRAVIREGGQSPAEISRRIIPVLSDLERTEALHVALPCLIRDEIRKLRYDAYGPRDTRTIDGRGRGDITSRWQDPVTGEIAQATDASAVAARAKRQREAGRAGFDVSQERREREQVLLRTPITVHGTWKTLGECTPEDLRAVADDHRKRAGESVRRADGFERLALSLERAGARTVADYRGELREQIVGAPA